MSLGSKDNKNSSLDNDVIVACAQCAGGGSGIKGTTKRSRYSREEQSAPSVPPKVIFTPIPVRPVRDEIAAHGSYDPKKMGHLPGADVTFTEERAKEVLSRLPQGQELGQEPSGPCAYEVSQFVVCAGSAHDLKDCKMIEKDLNKCKKKNKLPSREP